MVFRKIIKKNIKRCVGIIQTILTQGVLLSKQINY